MTRAVTDDHLWRRGAAEKLHYAPHLLIGRAMLVSPVRSAALLAFVLGRCCMKAISSSRVDSSGHHHLGLGAGGSGKQTQVPPAVENTSFFTPRGENSYHTLALAV